MASDTQNSAFIKQLASSDRKIRDKAVESLRVYLRSRSSFDELELLKLWKGLFYCMWMSDRARTQQQLARDLASLVDEVRPNVVIPFLDAFWKTMAREWVGIDALRMDKFLYLVRQYLHASFLYLSRHKWSNTASIDAYMAVLESTPLNPTDNKIPNGIRFHVFDIYADELEKVGAGESEDVPIESLVKPLEKIRKESPNKVVRERAKDALDDERVRKWRGQEPLGNSTEDMADDDDEWGGIED
ncbi:hypothetical protein NA57DRAFT_45844 [Rhizodiscina lignyota]|uniref:Uncharacterized protein n=1 Tax=Rhizodiscina lignyota TaxID=1504668 RepID=A0A9P4M1Q4_9PEZI|nr:hypothetical protein NA57DRAFT_45844 [Rhizodiscina lignyota]